MRSVLWLMAALATWLVVPTDSGAAQVQSGRKAGVGALAGDSGPGKEPADAPREAEVIVPAAAQARTEVALDFKPGDYAVITVTGHWYVGPPAKYDPTGPFGDWWTFHNEYPRGALMAETGTQDSRKSWVLDRLSVLQIQEAGRLRLGMNDGDKNYGDNEGELRVKVRRVRSLAEVRKTLRLVAGAQVRPCTVFVAADDACKVYVNGEERIETSDWRHVYAFDTVLTNGDVIAIEAKNTGGANGVFAWIESPGCLPIGTDGSWRYSDFRKPRWVERSFNDKDWLPAVHAPHYWWMVPRAYVRGAGAARIRPIWGRTEYTFLRKRVHFRPRRYPPLPYPHPGPAGVEANAKITLCCDDACALYVNGMLTGVADMNPRTYRVKLERGDVIGVHCYDGNDGRKDWCGLLLHGQLATGGSFTTGPEWRWVSDPVEGWNRKSTKSRGWKPARVDQGLKEELRRKFVQVAPGSRAKVIWGSGPDVFFRYVVR